jgi:hypothetical protein
MHTGDNERLLPLGTLGYRIDIEDKPKLELRGMEPSEVLKAYKDAFPKWEVAANPLGVLDILNQSNQGACQGHSLASIFSSCYFLATGRRKRFSRAAGYYLSQRYDGIRGDNGSTLNGGRKVATEHGMCSEEDWPYPSRYDPTEPRNAKYVFKLKITKPFRTIKDLLDWIDSGLPVQTGVFWNDSCSREVVDNWRPGGGGHSTMFWQRTARGNVNNVNSWGGQWNGDGMHEWTEASIDRALRNNNSTFIGYAPDEMSFPAPEAIAV